MEIPFALISKLPWPCSRILHCQVHSARLLKTLVPYRHSHLDRTFTGKELFSTAPKQYRKHDSLYEPLEGIERLENYRLGGYHPVKIGEVLRHRYRVIHKLGHGTFSTTWLARDERSDRYVALKICIAESKSREVDIINSLARHETALCAQGRAMVPTILDTFTTHGPNGDHPCYATAPARASIADLKDGSWNRLFHLDVARALAAQLIHAVDFLHTVGIVHGDLHIGNILLKSQPEFDQISPEKIYETYGEPELEPIVRFDGEALLPGVPSHGVVPIWLGEASEKIKLGEARLLLTDFGESFSYPQETRYISHAPLVFRPPEARFEPNKPFAFSSDIWSLACTIWAIIAQRPLFEGLLATEDDMTCEQADTLGILPPEWWEAWEARGEKFTEDATPINRTHYRSWDDRFMDSLQRPREEYAMPLISPPEKRAIFDMLRPMLAFRPEDRSTAKQVLESEWMVKWALPEYEKIK
ncbi:kinase-like protein [Aaosphaeria arxii CBS 175.79]|uniref:non-specific serine/threonine protein kinase n=1 Tax=Aaosphaeria arxii CBS 175.79 TaxID=1450172 RepID=A0A6A5XMG9_9PLEO|nr:kinase-like protein [Aaosphaeria arxii CBS 175.79]KAF2013940.1 kinase-like protein [Aaosphaeria arxii CBS 175.79]